MKKSTVSYLLIYILLASITLTASVLAWVTLSKETNTGVIGSDIPDFTNMVEFEVKRTGETEYRVIKTIDDMHAVFGNTSPGEAYLFKIDIDNKLSKDLAVNLFLPRFSNEINPYYTGDPINDYSMLDVFYILDGVVDITLTDKTTLVEAIIANPTLADNGLGTPQKHGQVLNKYRISNLFNSQQSINLTALSIPLNNKATITFTLVYDALTKDNRYQNFVLAFDGIYIYSEQVA